jgi:hypothetical protein
MPDKKERPHRRGFLHPPPALAMVKVLWMYFHGDYSG